MPAVIRYRWSLALPLVGLALVCGNGPAAAQADCKGGLRKINVGVSVSPPNVVHTTPYVAKEFGIFAKHCIDANIIQFDGGESPAATAAVSQGTALANVNDVAIGRGLIGMVLADLYTAISGIGYLIVRTASTYQVDKMFVPIVTLGILGVTLTALLRVLEIKVAPWTAAAQGD